MKSSLDVRLDGEQAYVAMAVDMAIAEKAEVFVGNGVSSFLSFFVFIFFLVGPELLLTNNLLQFSSLSSNVVMLRMAKGLDPLTNRFL
jgi:hypothetical protein